MGQKLLSYLFYGFLVLMVIAALFLLKHQLDQKEVKQQQIDNRANVISRIDKQSTSEISPIEIDKASSTSSSKPEPGTQSTHQDNNQSLTYLEVYRQLQTAKACKPFFQHWQLNGIKSDLTEIIRPPVRFYTTPDYLPNEHNPISGGQKIMLDKWQSICKTLWYEYGLFNMEKAGTATLKNDIVTEITQRLATLPTKTNKEVILKKTRKISTLWHKRLNELDKVLAGEDTLPEVEIALIESDLDQLKRRTAHLNGQFVRDLSDDEIHAIATELNDLHTRSEALKEQIENQKTVDKNALAEAEASFENQNQALNQLLHGHDGDVFFEVLNTLEAYQNTPYTIYIGMRYKAYGKTGSYLILPSQMVFEHSQWPPSLMQINTLKYATHLYLCDIGWDCSADSPMMLQYCLFGMNAYPDACGLEVRDFYQQHLISRNHMIDVSYFKNIFRELFYE